MSIDKWISNSYNRILFGNKYSKVLYMQQYRWTLVSEKKAGHKGTHIEQWRDATLQAGEAGNHLQCPRASADDVGARGKGTSILEDGLPRRCKLLAHRPKLAGRSMFWAQRDFFKKI